MLYAGNAQNSTGVIPLPARSMYQGKKRNHPTARLRQIARRVRQLRATYSNRLAAALALGAMLYLSVR